MTILLADPRVAAVPVLESYQQLVTLGASFGPARARVRSSLAARLGRAQVALPVGLSLRVVEGHRSAAIQKAIIAHYWAKVSAAFPDASQEQRHRLASRLVAPLTVAAHVTGAAVDLTLVDSRGVELEMGTSIDTEHSASSADTGAADDAELPAQVRARRALLARVLTDVGLVNYPSEWWHWSYGDRYWALVTGADAALYGPVADLDRRVDEIAARWGGCVA
jgi:zinc D-Ala-D-Ala dipeptidase